ncbi:MAG: ATP-grasp domain-containing protein [Treponema sp.]
MRRILILGASLMQKPAIVEAKKLGCYVVAVDANPKAFCVDMVDRFEKIDLEDVPSLISFAKELYDNGGLSGVFTAATDFSASVASVTSSLNLKGHSLEAALNASDKSRMRVKFLQNNLPSPKFIEVDDCNFSSKDISTLSFPLVIKPVDNMGARGCVLVRNATELRSSIEKATRFSRTKRVIVEEFIEGPEFSIEGLVFNGNIYITALADRHIFFSPYFVEMGHTIPSNFPNDITEQIVSVFVRGVKALGLTHGACKGDIFFDVNKKQAVIGEIAARLSGGYMSGWTVPYSSNINITKLALKLALGEEITEDIPFPTKENTNNFASERAWISIPGVVSKIIGLEDAKTSNNVKDVFSRAKEESRVVFPENNVEKCGNVISVSSTYENAIACSKQAIKNIFLRLKPKDKSTDDFLYSFNDTPTDKQAYPPNYFVFPDINGTSLTELLNNSSFVFEDGIVYPLIFKDYLDFVSEPFGISIREAMEKAFLIEPKLKIELLELTKERKKEKLIRYWLAFIRGGVQGLIYWYDSYKNNGATYE